MQHALQLLRSRGYRPRVVIDCGANVGQWLQLAEAVFPEASWHVIEPQPQCVAALERLGAGRAGLTVHATALTEPGVPSVRMLGGEDGTGTGTGKFVAVAGEVYDDEITVPATTLDELLADRIRLEDRALLKLDVERHEIPVLRGATGLLSRVEVVLTETSVYDVAGHRPVFSDLVAFMRERAFDFYDVASLSGRARDYRLRQVDVIFVRRDSPLVADHDWA